MTQQKYQPHTGRFYLQKHCGNIMSIKIPIAGYLETGILPTYGQSAMKTIFHWSWVYSYLYFRPQKIVVIGRFFCMKRKFDICFADIISFESRRIFPYATRTNTIKLNITASRCLYINTFSIHNHAQLMQRLKSALPQGGKENQGQLPK